METFVSFLKMAEHLGYKFIVFIAFKGLKELNGTVQVLGGLLRRLREVLGRLGEVFGRLGELLGRMGGVLERSWSVGGGVTTINA